mgnify:FL=1
MKAKTQYNDIKGTAAADVSDHQMNSLQYYLEKTYPNYDSERYVCRGCSIWIGGQDVVPKMDIRFVCEDSLDHKYVAFSPKKEMSIEEILSLFKRFNIVMGKDIDDIEVNDDDNFELE